MSSEQPSYTSTRIWTRTVRKRRLIAALTGARIVAVLDRLADAEVNRLRQRERQGTARNDTAHDLYVSTQAHRRAGAAT